MIPLDFSLTEALLQTSQAARGIGIDVETRIASLRQFSGGPFVVAVAGRAKTGRTRIGTAIAAGAARPDILEVDFSGLADGPLWDVLVVVSPADRALSHSEEEIVRAARALRRRVTVALPRADLLGSGDVAQAARREIEQLRLAPALNPIRVRWFFCGSDQDLVGLVDHVATLLGEDPRAAHERAVTLALRQLLSTMVDSLHERVLQRSTEMESMQLTDQQLALAIAQLDEEVKLSQLAVRDDLREANASLQEAALGFSAAAATWSSSGSLGRWADVEYVLRSAWRGMLDHARSALQKRYDAFQAEARRISMIIEARIAALGMPAAPDLALSATWRTAEVDEVLAMLEAVDLEPLFETIEKECLEAVKTASSHEEADPEHPDGPKGVVTRLADSVKRLGLPPLQDRLLARIHSGLESMTAVPVSALIDTASIAVAKGAGRDQDVVVRHMQERVADLHRTLETRNSWGDAYGKILLLHAWAEQRVGLSSV